MRHWLIALLVACVACGAGHAIDEIVVDWDHPPGDPVSSVASVQGRIDFPIVTPRGLHGLRGIFAFPPKDITDAIWFVYDDPDFGRVWIVEGPPDMADPSERMAGYRSASDHADIVQVRDGATLFVGKGDHADGEFVEHGVQFQIRGPDLSEGDVIRIAGRI